MEPVGQASPDEIAEFCAFPSLVVNSGTVDSVRRSLTYDEESKLSK